MEGSNQQGGGGRERLLNDLKLVVRDAAQLMDGAALPDHERDAAVARLATTLDATRDSLAQVEKLVMDGARDAAAAADRYVQRNPWQAVGAGALAGIALGMLLGRR